MKTLTSRDLCERLYNSIGGFVSVAFDQAPAEFRAAYKHRAGEFPGGFRRIDLVPKGLLARKIAKDCVTDPSLSLLIMRNWFLAKESLRSSVTASLESLGYKVTAPDFEKDSIACQSLSPKHIAVEGDAYYFSPGGDTAGADKLELTVMAALLGWFPDPSEGETSEPGPEEEKPKTKKKKSAAK